ncbi:hypothetical protein Patl1_16195 [Pistacia atlantica]|uniref:Uncharacterized protein n=1 Tax=Pistacia atlantica TaxID=434234 RepID=A0ACC1BAY8_9ROSI|nr:hypothetical protein Patl1_16195 [Pistacia atlantica]
MLGFGVTTVMVAVEFLEVGLSTLTKAAINKGMSDFVFIVYTNAFAASFILLPSTLLYYRKRSRPLLTVSIVSRIFLLGLIGCCVQTFMITGIGFSSPTLSSAITNLTPAFTFILAISSRMEKLNLKLQSSLAKAIGTMVSIAGALTVTLFKGPAVVITSSPHNLRDEILFVHTNWLIGGLLLTAGSFSLSLLYIVQTSIVKDYPEELMVTFICCVFVTLQSAILALILEGDPNAWRLKPGMELMAILYSAVFAVALRTLVHTWACHKKGPVYVSMFKPLGIVIAMVMGVTFLGDTLYVGSVVGAVIIAFGFYSVMWGQTREEEMADYEGMDSLKPSSPKNPSPSKQ